MRQELTGCDIRRPAPEGTADLGSARRAIVACALAIVSEQGVGEVGVERLLADADVSAQTFHELFFDLEDCLDDVYEQALARAVARIYPAYWSDANAEARLADGLAALLSFVRDEPGLATFLAFDAARAGPTAVARRAGVLTTLAGALDQLAPSHLSGARRCAVAADLLAELVSLVRERAIESAYPDRSAHARAVDPRDRSL